MTIRAPVLQVKKTVRDVNFITQSYVSDKWKILDLCLGLVDYEVCILLAYYTVLLLARLV